MCAIGGIVHADPQHPIDRARLLALRESMVHRGPDDAGLYCAQGAGLVSRRLAIVDRSRRGRMPMRSPDGRYVIVYNGEVYNYRELRANLVKKGYRFSSQTDTETLLYLYIDGGPAMLTQLNGMFAMAIWDMQERQLFLARDRMGIKPLCYVRRDGQLHFASEEKALWVSGAAVEFDPDVWSELLCFRYIAGDRTMFKDVRHLLPGHYLMWRAGQTDIQRWWDFDERVMALREEPTPADTRAWYRHHFDMAVASRRMGDVPAGVLLSGGLDSSSVAASLAQQTAGQVASFTMRFDEPGYDEGEVAQAVVKQWQLQDHALTVSPKDELPALVEAASWLNDAPIVHASDPHLLAICRYAKACVTILLSGEGGDETLGGYVRYRPLLYPWLYRAGQYGLSPLLARCPMPGRLAKMARFWRFGSIEQYLLYNACEVLPGQNGQVAEAWGYRYEVLQRAQHLYPNDLIRQAMYSDQHTYLGSLLHRNDRMSMGASIECRVPFLDHRMIEGVAALPTSELVHPLSFMSTSTSKPLLRRALGDRLPKAVLRHRKMGFGVPWAGYMRTIPAFSERLRELPRHAIPLELGCDQKQLQQMVGSFMQGDNRPWAFLQQLLFTAIWADVYQATRQPLPCLEIGADADFSSL